jgi:hypothetical protein
MPLLNIGFDVPQRWFENQLRAGGAIKEWKVKADPSLTMNKLRDGFAQIMHKNRDNPRLVMVDPQPVTCEHGHCYLVRNGQANFRDTAHISNVNAIQYRGLFDAALRSALRADTEQRIEQTERRRLGILRASEHQAGADGMAALAQDLFCPNWMSRLSQMSQTDWQRLQIVALSCCRSWTRACWDLSVLSQVVGGKSDAQWAADGLAHQSLQGSCSSSFPASTWRWCTAGMTVLRVFSGAEPLD